MDDSDIQREHFNKISDRYLTARSDKRHLAYKDVFWDYVFKIFAELVPDPGSVHGLDAMCGNAEISHLFLSRYPTIKMSAFDYSDQMVESAREQASENIDVFQADILDLNKQDEYDFVVLVGGLHHVPNHVDAAVKQINKALKPGGLFMNFEPTHNNFLWKRVRESIYKKNDLFEESTERGFSLKEYNALFTDNNFEITRQFYSGLLGYIMYYNPDAFPFLNKGPVSFAKASCKFDIALGNTFIGKYLSFTSSTFARKK